MAFVLDCSVTMAWIFPDEATEATDRVRDSLVEGRAFVPSLWAVEVGNVLLVATRRGRVRVDEWPAIRANLEALPIEIDPVTTSRVWGASLDLAQTHRISVYDAMYLELAVRLQLPLASLDRALPLCGGAGRRHRGALHPTRHGGFSMKQFAILQHPALGYEVVKLGWSWPAFFFTWIWAFLKRLWLVGVIVLLAGLALSSLPEIWLVGELIISIVMGVKGNELRVNAATRFRIRTSSKRSRQDTRRCTGRASRFARE